MSSRAKQKRESRNRILKITGARMRKEGIDGASIAKIMRDAGLTHGAFYAYFHNKNELAQAGFQHAIDSTQPRWFGSKHGDESFAARLKRLAATYLSKRHRDSIDTGCAISALATDVPRSGEDFQAIYELAVKNTLKQIGGDFPDKQNEAILFLSLCVGGLLLSRNVQDEELSRQILETTRSHIEEMA